MGEEASDGYYDRIDAVAGEDDNDGNLEDEKVLEWEIGLPSGDELAPLSQPLVPPALASAFRINPEPPKSLLDVHRASQHTISNLRRVGPSAAASAALRSFHPFPSHPAGDAPDDEDETMDFEGEELAGSKDVDGVESSSRKVRRMDSSSPSSAATATEEVESYAVRAGISNDDQSAKMLKRARLVWTPQLHKRFVDVVTHLGIKNAVPKTIMQLMNVEGLTRENVASHLQKYRLYLKRMHCLSDEGPSPSDQLFASTLVPQSLHDQQAPAPIPVPVPYVVPTMYPMPMFGVAHPRGPGNQMGVVPVNKHQIAGTRRAFEPHHPYGAFGELQKDRSGGKQFGSIVSYPRVTPSDK